LHLKGDDAFSRVDGGDGAHSGGDLTLEDVRASQVGRCFLAKELGDLRLGLLGVVDLRTAGDPLVLMWLQSGMALGLPRGTWLRDGLIRPRFVFTQLHVASRFRMLTRQLDQSFLRRASARRRS
jgi:hypothetical protein